MATIKWKENALIAIKLKSGKYCLAKMLISPYIVFYNYQFDDINNWEKGIENSPSELFCSAVAKQFLKNSTIVKLKTGKLEITHTYPTKWIKVFPESRKVTIWENTENELSFFIIGSPAGGQLIKRDISKKGIQKEEIISSKIDLNDNETIDKYETTSIGLFPQLNERLFLCFKFSKNIDPEKDIVFNRQIPFEYKTYMEMMAFKGSLADWGYES